MLLRLIKVSCIANSLLISLISFSRLLIYAVKSCVTLIVTSFCIFAILLANLNVEHVSSINPVVGHILANMIVLLLPPIESRKKLVNLDCL